MYNYEGRRDPTVGTAFGRTSAAREQDGSVGGSQRVGDSPALALTSCGTVETVEPKEDSLLPLDWKQASYNYSQTPDGQYSADRLKASEQAVRVAKNGFAPSLSLSLRNQLVISSWNPYDQDRSRFDGGNFMGFEVGVGITLFYGATRAKVKAARKEREMIALEIKEQEQLRQQE